MQTGKDVRRLAGERAWRFARRLALAALVVPALWLAAPAEARAEYGDVVINNYSDKAGMRPPVFPHWFHRMRFSCKTCHSDLGIRMRAGGNDINMVKIIDGQYCGACHNGELAWSSENCSLCHTGMPGTPTQVHESTQEKLAVPRETRARSAPHGSGAGR